MWGGSADWLSPSGSALRWSPATGWRRPISARRRIEGPKSTGLRRRTKSEAPTMPVEARPSRSPGSRRRHSSLRAPAPLRYPSAMTAARRACRHRAGRHRPANRQAEHQPAQHGKPSAGNPTDSSKPASRTDASSPADHDRASPPRVDVKPDGERHRRSDKQQHDGHDRRAAAARNADEVRPRAQTGASRPRRARLCRWRTVNRW